MRKIWSRADIDKSRDYVLLLFENDAGVRDFEICEADLAEEKARDKDCVFVTQVVPVDLALTRDVLGIAESVKLNSGDPFFFNADGVWFTKEETEDLDANKTAIRWIRGHAPLLPRR